MLPNGKFIGPPMPAIVYRQLSDGDAEAIAASLRSRQPVSHHVDRSQYKIALPSSYGPPGTHVSEPTRGVTAAYGGYLVSFGHCMLCHTPAGGGQPIDMSR